MITKLNLKELLQRQAVPGSPTLSVYLERTDEIEIVEHLIGAAGKPDRWP